MINPKKISGIADNKPAITLPLGDEEQEDEEDGEDSERGKEGMRVSSLSMAFRTNSHEGGREANTEDEEEDGDVAEMETGRGSAGGMRSACCSCCRTLGSTNGSPLLAMNTTTVPSLCVGTKCHVDVSEGWKRKEKT